MPTGEGMAIQVNDQGKQHQSVEGQRRVATIKAQLASNAAAAAAATTTAKGRRRRRHSRVMRKSRRRGRRGTRRR